MEDFQKIIDLLSVDADDLLNHKCKTFDKSLFNLPNPNYIEDVLKNSNRSP